MTQSQRVRILLFFVALEIQLKNVWFDQGEVEPRKNGMLFLNCSVHCVDGIKKACFVACAYGRLKKA